MALASDAIIAKVDSLEGTYRERDMRMRDVKESRAGNLAFAFPDFFSSDMQRPMVANWIDIVARNYSEQVAPLPTLSCLSQNMTSDRARKFAVQRQRIGTHYWVHSNLAIQMHAAADQYFTYGFTCLEIQPDFEDKLPRFKFLDSVGSYPEFTPNMDTRSFTRKWQIKASKVAAMYPHARAQLESSPGYGNSVDRDIWLYRYVDADQTMLFVKDQEIVLERYENKLDCCPVIVAVRPTHDGEMRGAFDDVLGPLAARALLMRLNLEAAEKQVQAPLAVPDDVSEFSIGPDAVMSSATPEKIGRVKLEVGSEVFAELQTLEQELRLGTRYPESQSGDVKASIITGQGVEALNGVVNTQVRSTQLVFGQMLRKATKLAYHLDETYWPNTPKTIWGTSEGSPFSINYTPSQAIAGDHTCDVTYGMMSGMDPSRGLVFVLQALGAGLVDRQTAMRQMPWDIDVAQLQKNIEIEQLRQAGVAGIQALVQALGPMIEQGMDGSKVLTSLSNAIGDLQKGKPIEDALLQFTPPPPPQPEESPDQQGAGAAGGGPGGSLPPGVQASGLLSGVAPGQAGQAPGGRPSLQQLMASVKSNGTPNISAGVRRNPPAVQ